MTRIIKGYTSSDGTVSDIKVELIGIEGYHGLVTESIQMIDTLLKTEVDPDRSRALTELKDSYQKTLNNEHPKKEFHPEPGATYLSHCLRLEQIIISAPEKKPRKYRNRITELKDEYRSKILPIRNYIGMLKLAPGKYDSMI